MRIAKTLETVILADVYPKSRINVMIQVLQADGGISL
jgi:ribonuclease PH